MGKDLLLKRYYADNDRYADLINGLTFEGEQVLHGSDIQESDSRTVGFSDIPFVRNRRKGRRGREKYRDLIRRVALGVNFVVIGVENQEEIDYSIPLRNLIYDAGEYERQATVIRRKVRKHPEGLTPGEYLYGFRRDSRLYPCVTFILYYGSEDWDGPTDLASMLDFRDIPPQLQKIVPNYKINLIEIRKLEDTTVFQTDIKQVFDFIRCSGDPAKLKNLVETDPAYQAMEEDAYDLAAQYTRTEELMKKKTYNIGGKINMCNAIAEWIKEEKDAERSANIQILVRTCLDFNIPQEQIRERIMSQYGLTASEAEKYMDGSDR